MNFSWEQSTALAQQLRRGPTSEADNTHLSGNHCVSNFFPFRYAAPQEELREIMTEYESMQVEEDADEEDNMDDEDSRAGDWEPNMEYGDTMIGDDDHHMGFSGDHGSHESISTVQIKRRANFTADYEEDMHLERQKRIKIEEHIDMGDLPNFIPIDEQLTYQLKPRQNAAEDLRRQRSKQRGAWIKLVTALATARSQLQGGDLELFEALIERPAPGVDAMQQIERWIWDTSNAAKARKENTKAMTMAENTKAKSMLCEQKPLMDVGARIGKVLGIKYNLSDLEFL